MAEESPLDYVSPANVAQIRPVLAQVIRDPRAALARLRALVQETTAESIMLRTAVGLAISQSAKAADVLLPGGAFELCVQATLWVAKAHGQNIWRHFGGLVVMMEALQARKGLLGSKTIQQAFHDLVDRLWAERSFLTREALHIVESGHRWIALSSFVRLAQLGHSLEWPSHHFADENRFYAPLIAMHFTASTNAMLLATEKTVFSAARSKSAQDGKNCEIAREAAFGIGPIMCAAEAPLSLAHCPASPLSLTAGDTRQRSSGRRWANCRGRQSVRWLDGG